MNVGCCDFEILRFNLMVSCDEPISVFTKFIPRECSKDFTSWTNTAEKVSSEEEAHKLIDNIIKQLKDGYIKQERMDRRRFQWVSALFKK